LIIHVPTMSILLILLPPSWLVPSIGSSRTTRISNFSATDLVRSSFGTWVSPTSWFFLGLPLLRGIYCWEDRAATILPFCSGPSTLGSARCDTFASVGKEKTPFGFSGAPVVSENESQSFWGSGLEIMLLRVPFLMFWKVIMA
jgi:hypothetical protein